jgi:hypothetical protein
MHIGLHREAGRTVPEAVGDRPGIDALGDEVGGVAVSEIMRPDAREAEAGEPRVVVPIPDIVLV